MTNELKACPFCGGEPTVDSNGVVWCPCFHESVETWNKRSNKAKTLSEITGEIVIDAEMKAVGQAVLQELKRLQYRIAELTELKERFDITDGLLNQATVSIGAVIACCTYNSNAEAMAGAFGISHRAFTMIDNFIKNYNRAVLDGKISTDVKNNICWPNPPEVE